MKHKALRIFFLALLIHIQYVCSQNIIIHGNAHPAYLNKGVRVAELFTYKDFITKNLVLESKDSLDEKGRFTLKFYCETTQPVIIKLKNAVGKIYVQPIKDKLQEYIIKFYPPDSVQVNSQDIELKANVSILTNDSLELNTLIFDFNTLYNKYMAVAQTKFLNKPTLYKVLDSIFIEAKEKYKSVNNPFFKSFIDYTMAGLNTDATRDRVTIANHFIINKPVLEKNFAYMEFFNSYFNNYLIGELSLQKNKTIYYVVNNEASIKKLIEYTQSNVLLSKNDTLKELVIIQNLYHFYYNEKFNPHSVQIILEQLLRQTKINYHRTIIQNIIQEFNQLKEGSPAPEFTALNRDSSLFDINQIKNQYIYLTFFSVKSPLSLKEMKEISFLFEKLGHKMQFVSICVDEDFNTYKDFLKKNPTYKWTILFNHNPQKTLSAKVMYNVKAVPLCFLIAPDKSLKLSPAPTPSEGVYYKLNLLFKKPSNNRIK